MPTIILFTVSVCFALSLAGLVALLSGQTEKPDGVGIWRYVFTRIWSIVALIVVAWILWDNDWQKCAFVLIMVSAIPTGWLMRMVLTEYWRYGYGVFASLALIVIGLWLGILGMEIADSTQGKMRAQEQLLAGAKKAALEEFTRLRVKRDPSVFQDDGVKEAHTGPLYAWLALKQVISVDWEYEVQLENEMKAQRTIPLRIAILNNQFQPTGLVAIKLSNEFVDGENQSALWLAWISRQNDRKVLAYFSHLITEEHQLFSPGERADFTVTWDGRDYHGQLLPPDNYTVHLQTAGLDDTREPARLAVNFAIRDDGPVVTVIPDPASELMRNMERNRELQQMQQQFQRTLDDTRRMQETIRNHSTPFPFPGRY